MSVHMTKTNMLINRVYIDRQGKVITGNQNNFIIQDKDELFNKFLLTLNM